MDESQWIDVGSVEELAKRELQPVTAGRNRIALSCREGAFSAVSGLCNHVGGPLGEGRLDGSTVTCPWHLWQFDVKSGECQNSPGDRVRAYDVIVEGDRVRVKI